MNTVAVNHYKRADERTCLEPRNIVYIVFEQHYICHAEGQALRSDEFPPLLNIGHCNIQKIIKLQQHSLAK
ncbi:MAG: hypothetical protein GDA45_02245 [Chromatiales bacterium]|nr:hypothetical protein [Chromatiales bacterium]